MVERGKKRGKKGRRSRRKFTVARRCENMKRPRPMK
jgi:hypothetical protein